MKKEKRDFKGIWIPKEIWLSKELSVMEKLFLVEIDSLDNNKGCYASNKYFSEFFQLSRNRCSEIIKSLENKNYIKTSYSKKGNQIIKRTIEITPIRKIEHPRSENRTPPFGKLGYPYSENTEENNTSINNTFRIKEDFSISEEKLLEQIGKTQFSNLIKIIDEEVPGYELLKNGNYFIAFIEWLKWKKEEGPYKGKMGMKKILKESLEVGKENAIKDIKTSTGKWAGIFFNKKDNGSSKDKKPVKSYYEKFK